MMVVIYGHPIDQRTFDIAPRSDSAKNIHTHNIHTKYVLMHKIIRTNIYVKHSLFLLKLHRISMEITFKHQTTQLEYITSYT